MEVSLEQILIEGARANASDIHITVGQNPVMRLNGDLHKMARFDKISVEDMKMFFNQYINDKEENLYAKEQWVREGSADFSISIPDIARFRVNVYKQRGSATFAIRIVKTNPPSINDIGLPEYLKSICRVSHGLVIVTGPTGSGKSTTLAAMIDQINSEQAKNIITLEHPIEYLHKHKKSIVNQREIPLDSPNFPLGLRTTLRDDPDVIMIGEMRDKETIATAIEAAETGHLVFSTLHTGSAAQSINRMIDVMGAELQSQIRTQLSSVLIAVIAQRLVPRCDGTGRVAAMEIMTGTTSICNLIRQGNTHQLDSVIETSVKHGMQTMQMSLTNLVNKRIIHKEVLDQYLSEKSNEYAKENPEIQMSGLRNNFVGGN